MSETRPIIDGQKHIHADESNQVRDEEVSLARQNKLVELEAQDITSLPRQVRNKIIRQIALLKSEIRRQAEGGFGRRIPEHVSELVIARDLERDFGRPKHACVGARPPHHIEHFETFKGGKSTQTPHTADNLEAPCRDCHDLAHALEIKSGLSIETMFRSFSPGEWQRIEESWQRGETYKLKKIAQDKRFDNKKLS